MISGLTRTLREFDELHVGRRRKSARNILLRDETEGDQRVDDGGAFVLRGTLLTFKGLILCDEIGVLEKLQDIGFVGGHLGEKEEEWRSAGKAGNPPTR